MYISASSGGNPAEWIVTDVIPSSQLGQGNRLPTHMQLTIGRLCTISTGNLRAVAMNGSMTLYLITRLSFVCVGEHLK